MVASLKDLPIPPRHTLEEYFAFNEIAEARYEYWDGEFVCMSGGSPAHATICSNLNYRVRQKLEGKKCQAFTSEMAIKTAALPPFRYPDLSVVCGEPLYEKVERYTTLTNPIVLIEVLSPGTIHRDRNDKRIAYQALNSLQEYLLVAQDAPLVTRYAREGAQWVRYDYEGLEAAMEIASLQCHIPLVELYQNLNF